jgi:hypothetical protein
MSIIRPSVAFKAGADWVSGEVRAYMKDQVATHLDTVADLNDNDLEQTRFVYIREKGAFYRLNLSSAAADNGDTTIHDNLSRRYQKLPGVSGPSAGYLPFTPVAPAVELYRNDTTSGAFPRSATISSVAGNTITLTTTVAGNFFVPGMAGHSLIRIWNTSKSPWQPAWVSARPTTSSLQVHDAASIATWANGETIQVGDTGSPLAPALGNIATIDISPGMQAVYGSVFRQSAVVLSANIISGAAAGDSLNFTSTGGSGTTVAVTKVFVNTISSGSGNVLVACSELSPVSNSNVVKLQESFAGNVGVRLVRCQGLFL